MFSTNIVESDAFLDMPLTAQSLYMHLNMNADNDGFVNPRRIMRMIGAANDDLQILIAKRFLLAFDSGVVVIKHWWINNTIRRDRYSPTTHQQELSELIQNHNNSYSRITTQLQLETAVEQSSGNQMATNRQPMVASTQHNTTHSNTTQHSSIQLKSTHSKTAEAVDFEKNKMDQKQKRSYAIAVKRDEALSKKEQSRKAENGNGYRNALSIAEALKQKKG